MKEIKFRAWVLGKMYAVTNMEWQQDGLSISTAGGFMTLPDKNAVLMQYTGLKDKNGREIYEGDIVTHPLCVKEPRDASEPCEHFVGVIQFETDRGQWFAVNRKRNGYIIDMTQAYKFEVIGNIYETPELVGK